VARRLKKLKSWGDDEGSKCIGASICDSDDNPTV
jgi:hypothetical protein